jgi:anti-anti-sigma factor
METINIHLANKFYNPQEVDLQLDRMNRITVLNSENLKAKLIALISRNGMKVSLNLRNINFVDSSGFDCLNYVAKVARQFQSEIVLKEVQPELMELIELVRKHGVFDIKNVQPIIHQEKVA